MQHSVRWLTAVVAIASGLAAANWARADVTIPLGWEVETSGYVSKWMYLGDINASGASQLQLSIDIRNPANNPGFQVGPIVDLVDNNGVWNTSAWYGETTPGSYVLTANLSTVTGFNFADIQHIHLECDPGPYTGLYDLNFKELVITTIPEPTALAVLTLGAL